MSRKKLYVGNLSYAVTKEMLEELFGAVGKVETVNIVTDRYSGQSRGFGFVEMSSDSEAAEAIKKLNGQTVAERQIIVNEARSDEKEAVEAAAVVDGDPEGAASAGERRGSKQSGGRMKIEPGKVVTLDLHAPP